MTTPLLPPVDPQQLSLALQQALPPEFEALGEQLAGYVLRAYGSLADDITERPAIDSELMEALRALAGRPIILDQRSPSITVGNITNSSAIAIGIGSVALSVNVAMPPAAISVIDADQIRQLDIWSEAPSTERFIGRETETRELHTMINDPSCRLVLVAGLGGAGKSFECDQNLWETVVRSRFYSIWTP